MQEPAATPVTAPITYRSRAEAIDLAPGVRVGEYVIQRRVGRGGMGSVYGAVHPVIGKKAAIKVIAWDLCRDPAFVARFVEEARAVNLIGHPNIVESFSMGTLPDGRSYYVMEWLDGVSLADRLKRGRVPLAEALDILDDTADALEAVHAKGIVHRDLTPRNLFLVADRNHRQTVKVFDFGLAKRVEMAPDDRRLTRSGVMIGTPTYASPEQLCGDSTDHRSDVYSLGVIAYEILLGQRPYDDPQLRALVTRKLTEPPPPPRSLWPRIPLELEWLLGAMLGIDPTRRPDLAAVRRALARARSAPVERAPERPRRAGRIALVLGAFALAGGLTAAAFGIAAQDTPAETPPPLEAPAPADPPPADPPATTTTPASADLPPAEARPAPARAKGEPRRSRRAPARKAAPPARAPAPPDPDRYLLEPGR